MFDFILMGATFALYSYIFFHIGIYFGERKKIEALKETDPPELPFNAGVISRFLYNRRLNDYVRWSNTKAQVSRDRLDLANLKVEHEKVKEENEKLKLLNRKLRTDVEQREHKARKRMNDE